MRGGYPATGAGRNQLPRSRVPWASVWQDPNPARPLDSCPPHFLAMKTPSSLLRTAKQASCAMFACLDQQRAIRFPLPPATMAGRVSSFYLRHIYSHAFVFALDKHAVGFLSVQIERYISS
ncbi:hypothetical protein SORBI_3006G269250 [Sorghum bicolor]|uniref:Uncharacterized protein n=1 Tax=Sorghum bicolor TaxID=4558 RepID=A0A1Z5RFP2_SORBI|nr:hypothetical protein SORBI_3006G269250 [Sorghum bicolor]